MNSKISLLLKYSLSKLKITNQVCVFSSLNQVDYRFLHHHNIDITVMKVYEQKRVHVKKIHFHHKNPHIFLEYDDQ